MSKCRQIARTKITVAGGTVTYRNMPVDISNKKQDVEYMILTTDESCEYEDCWKEMESGLTLDEAIKLRDKYALEREVYIVADV